MVRGALPYKLPNVHCHRRKVCAAHPKSPGLTLFASSPRSRLIIRVGNRLQPCYLIRLLLYMTYTSGMRAGSPGLKELLHWKQVVRGRSPTSCWMHTAIAAKSALHTQKRQVSPPLSAAPTRALSSAPAAACSLAASLAFSYTHHEVGCKSCFKSCLTAMSSCTCHLIQEENFSSFATAALLSLHYVFRSSKSPLMPAAPARALSSKQSPAAERPLSHPPASPLNVRMCTVGSR